MKIRTGRLNEVPSTCQSLRIYDGTNHLSSDLDIQNIFQMQHTQNTILDFLH